MYSGSFSTRKCTFSLLMSLSFHPSSHAISLISILLTTVKNSSILEVGLPKVDMADSSSLPSQALSKLALSLTRDRKGVLAADESVNTAGKRLHDIGVENTEENRRRMREWILNADGLHEHISGVILFQETLYQCDAAGERFVDALTRVGIVPGVKVDTGTVPLRRCAKAGNDDDDDAVAETITQGLDGLDARLKEYVCGKHDDDHDATRTQAMRR